MPTLDEKSRREHEHLCQWRDIISGLTIDLEDRIRVGSQISWEYSKSELERGNLVVFNYSYGQETQYNLTTETTFVYHICRKYAPANIDLEAINRIYRFFYEIFDGQKHLKDLGANEARWLTQDAINVLDEVESYFIALSYKNEDDKENESKTIKSTGKGKLTQSEINDRTLLVLTELGTKKDKITIRKVASRIGCSTSSIDKSPAWKRYMAMKPRKTLNAVSLPENLEDTGDYSNSDDETGPKETLDDMIRQQQDDEKADRFNRKRRKQA